ncbi:zinc-dependent alcohol dehydrogenase [Candidatus Micrarchaeota archaeon]|nr:MAG: zinc-dependent alcohol dehydrogenase [Candidatus Micrarchaeota archaeon]
MEAQIREIGGVLMAKMKAAIFKETNKPLEVTEIDKPVIEEDEDVIVKVVACGLCHTDLGYIDYGVPTFKKPPLVLGHEPSGIVEEIGSKVTNVKVGDRVLIGPITCGNCFYCRNGRENICQSMMMIGNNLDGAFAEYVKVPARCLVKLPEELPLKESCVISDAVVSPYHAVKRRAKVGLGDWVAVFGCGGVGINCVQWANLAGGLVIAVDIMDHKLQLAKELGAVAIVNAKKVENVPKEVRKISGGGVDIAMECIGNPDVITQAFDATRDGGKVCVVGYSFKSPPLKAARLMYREMEITGSIAGLVSDYERIFNLIKTGKFRVDRLITSRYPLDKINEAFDELRKGEAIRIIVEME